MGALRSGAAEQGGAFGRETETATIAAAEAPCASDASKAKVKPQILQLPIANRRRTRGVALQGPSVEEGSSSSTQLRTATPSLAAGAPKETAKTTIMLPATALPISADRRTRAVSAAVVLAQQDPSGFEGGKFLAALMPTPATEAPSGSPTPRTRRFVHFADEPVPVIEYTPASAYSVLATLSPASASSTPLSSSPPSRHGAVSGSIGRLMSPRLSPIEHHMGAVLSSAVATAVHMQVGGALPAFKTAAPPPELVTATVADYYPQKWLTSQPMCYGHQVARQQAVPISL